MMRTTTLLVAFVIANLVDGFSMGVSGRFAAPLRVGTSKMAEIGNTGVSFTNVAREWRCKYSAGPSGGPGDSDSLKACNDLLTEYLPKLKALPGAEITRQVCGGCLDFKVSITQPLAEHSAWAAASYNPLEEVITPLPQYSCFYECCSIYRSELLVRLKT